MLVKFTRVNDEPVYVNPDRVCSVYVFEDRTFGKRTRIHMFNGSGCWEVKEELDRVIEILNSRFNGEK